MCIRDRDTAGVDVIVYLAEQMSAQVGAHGAVNGGNVLLLSLIHI